jgi:xanthine dehydrogenase accessory factor
MAIPSIDLFRAAQRHTSSGGRVAVASVVATSGSTPQKAGARMLILDDGSTLGTIGGGCIEAEVWADARRMLRHGESGLRTFHLADDPDAPSGDVCGGTMHVFIDILMPPAPEMPGRSADQRSAALTASASSQ